MADVQILEPDLDFIRKIGALGGEDLKKCYQCATCSVACTITPENKPFPRKEMIAASWGLKDKLVKSADIWLCHNCGDCTTLCPRTAKPGDVLAAVRAYTVSEYATPKVLAMAVQNPKKLPILLALPAAIILIAGLIFNMLGLGWMNFAPEGDHLWQASYFSNYMVDLIMIPTFNAAIIVFALGLKRFLADIHQNALAEGKTDKTTIDPVGFIKALIRAVPTILKHQKFNECTENIERSTAHMMVMFGFIGCFIVTACFFIAEWVLFIEGPYPQISPIKWIANASGISLIIGGSLLLKNRMKKTDSINSYWDWSLLGLVLALGLTGMLTEITRMMGLYGLSAIIYFLHLVFVWSLFAYTPFSKLAHLVYRIVAIAYAEYSGRGFKLN
jgi:quinone-modifying oxidoreductase, subunit QmoC